MVFNKSPLKVQGRELQVHIASKVNYTNYTNQGIINSPTIQFDDGSDSETNKEVLATQKLSMTSSIIHVCVWTRLL